MKKSIVLEILFVLIFTILLSCSNKNTEIEKEELLAETEIENSLINDNNNEKKISNPGMINDYAVRLRKGPSLSSEIITKLEYEEMVDCLGISHETQTIGDLKSEWVKIRRNDDTEGWMYGAFIDINFDKTLLPVESISSVNEEVDKKKDFEYQFFSKNVLIEDESKELQVINTNNSDTIFSDKGLILYESPKVFSDEKLSNQVDINLPYLLEVNIVEERPWEYIENSIRKIFKIQYQDNLYFITSDNICSFFDEFDIILVKDAFSHLYNNEFYYQSLFIIEYQQIGIMKNDEILLLSSFFNDQEAGFATTKFEKIHKEDLNNDSINEICVEKIGYGGYYYSDSFLHKYLEYINTETGETMLSILIQGGGLAVDDQTSNGEFIRKDINNDGLIDTILYKATEESQTDIIFDEPGITISELYLWENGKYNKKYTAPSSFSTLKESIQLYVNPENSLEPKDYINKGTVINIEEFEFVGNELWVSIIFDGDKKGWIESADIDIVLEQQA